MREKIKDKWRDLGPRVVSGLALAAIGGGALWVGGAVFLVFITLSAGLMVWEIYRMAAPGQDGLAKIYGLLSAVGFAVAIMMPFSGEGLIFLTLAVGIYLTATRDRLLLALYAFLVLAACGAMWLLRERSLQHAVWLVLVVVSSDVLGYFVGKTFGGPKFWPAVSPKKTWSGTIGGWIGAGVIGVLFAHGGAFEAATLALTSVLMAFAGQMGDIAESALKRRAGIKDSSGLIPGHGGLLDRFDALMCAAIVLGTFMVVAQPFIAAQGYR